MPAYRAAVNGETVTNEILLLEGRGNARWFIFNTAPLFVSGKHIGAILSMQDITVLQQQNMELVKAKEKAEESDRFKTSFIANISHEIRTPMSSIMGFADLLKFPDISGESQQLYIDAIITGGKRMLNIINDLINISKIEAGSIEMKSQVTDIHKLMDEMVVFFLSEANKKSIHLKVNNELPLDKRHIETDGTKVSQILTNLIKNALKFTGRGTVEFGCRMQNEFCLFYVKDTGIGIKKEQQTQIFDRFQQGESTSSGMQEGVGLGLPISKAYVEALGGSIWVDSDTNRGSVFYFTIPYKEPGSLNTSARDAELNVAAKLPYAEVLIVEDEESIYDLMRELLRRKNIKTFHAANGEEAINMVNQNPSIQLVFMDGRMPVMNGTDATRHIKHIRPALPIIGLSALANDSDRETALQAGCVDYITKPLDKEVLYEKVEAYLGR